MILSLHQCESLDSCGRIVTSVQTILTCSKLISPAALRQALQFIYTGHIDQALCDLAELKQVREEQWLTQSWKLENCYPLQAAEFLSIPQLYSFVTRMMSISCDAEEKAAHLLKHKEENTKVWSQLFDVTHTVWCYALNLLLQSFQRTLEESFLCQALFADVLFRLEDGALPAHKPVLMARCDMMQAMFTHDDFVESSARIVKFPGKSRLSPAYKCTYECVYYYRHACAKRVTI